MNKFAWLALALMLGTAQTAGAAIYKWKDKDGVTRYSDTPPPAGVNYETMGGSRKPQSVTPPAAPAAAKTEQQPEAATAETPEQAQERQRVEAENKRIRAQNCTAARANLQAFTQGGRLSRINEKGEREYLGDEDLAREAEKARKDIAEYCD
ncbi:MAG TPA: DUF4124 domain-containing protein [Methylophilaceae bacterium]|jgi:hypothetical protein